MHPSRSGSAGSPLTASLLTRVSLPRRGGDTRAELRVLPVLSGLRLGQPPVTAAPTWHGRSLSAAPSALKIPRKAMLEAAPRPRRRPGCFPAFVDAFSGHPTPASLDRLPCSRCLSRRAGLGQGLLGNNSAAQGRSESAHLLFDVMES